MSFYLEPGLKQSAEAGEHNFLNKVAAVGRAAGITLKFRDAKEAAVSDPSEEYAVLHMDPPPHQNAVTVRRAYYYPFWSIERTAKRWDFDVAKAVFDPADVPARDAASFVNRWRRKWFEGWAPGPTGHVYIPLQGRLLERRSFQSCTPIEMIRAVLAHDRDRPVFACLHPGERYSAEDIAALDKLEHRNPRFAVQMGGMATLLPGCDYVVTQNSSVGLAGYVFAKPLVLFGRIDFHHIALKPYDSSPAKAIRAAPLHHPDFDAYVWWFLQKMAINAGRPEAEEKIAARLRGFGWPV
ncbi:hypothetical protein NO357_10480 [Marimonas arenosa]|uniref:Capsule polysaccharide biosynthesis protein n=2 Tax=Marimonas arenosa TaxID=1795305 RepID=A0AAE4B4P3_9RHOB|nr:hypothetical protein [Marimonas arenosa]